MKFDLKKRFFFCKVIGYKSGNYRNNRGLKKHFFKLKKIIKKKKKKTKDRMIVQIVKIYLGLFPVLLWVLWVQFIFG